jgi:hypothetical protein
MERRGQPRLSKPLYQSALILISDAFYAFSAFSLEILIFFIEQPYCLLECDREENEMCVRG